MLTQEEGESLRERNSALTTALKAALEALGECQALLANYTSQVRCLEVDGPAGHASVGMISASAIVPCGPSVRLHRGLPLTKMAALF